MGNWLGTFLNTFWMNQEKFNRAGFERATSGLHTWNMTAALYSAVKLS